MALVQANNETVDELTARVSSIGAVKREKTKKDISDEERDGSRVNEVLLFSKMMQKKRKLIVKSSEILNYDEYMKLIWDL